MKIRICCATLVLFLFSVVCLAQKPAGALTGGADAAAIAGANEVSVDFLVPAKSADPLSFGVGGQVTASHFFDEHFGVKLESDYEKTTYVNFHDYGFRVGPVVHFGIRHWLQPYVEALVGYARVESSYLTPVNSYHGSGSVLAGGGFDFPLAGGWYAKAGVDVQEDWSVSTTVARGLVGVSYRFGAR